jgi:hypothetical protein
MVGGHEYMELTGQVKWRGTNIVADLMGSTGQQSQFYRGMMTLEKPFFAQGGAASGGAGPASWFVISINPDCGTVLKHLDVVMGLTNATYYHPAVPMRPAATPVPRPAPIDPSTGLPTG